MTRDDLAHLSPEALTQLTNAGIVKRAVRELAAGYRPTLALDDAATLEARFDDGVHCTWPRGASIVNARCSCGASGVCRHRVIAVLAWREERAGAGEGAAAGASEAGAGMRDADARQADSIPAGEGAGTTQPARQPAAQHTPVPRDVADLADDDLARLVPAAVMQAAQRRRDEGLTIELRRRASGEPCDTARLPSATVRYWAGAAIEAARCDCIATSGCEHVVLGVWAFRAARERAESAAQPIVTVRLGPPGARHVLDTQPFRACVAALLANGVLQGGGALAQGFTAARAASADAAWLALLIADLEAWAAAYAQRSALYDAADGVDLVAELALRLAAGPKPGHAGAVLGVGQAGESALDRLRLTSLGARTRRDGDQRITTIVLADVDTGTRMVLRHDWKVDAAREADEARLRAAERVAPGVLLNAIAHGQLLSQQAVRRADGSVRLARARSSQNSVLPQPGDWASLGAPLRFDSVAALRAEARAHPHAALEPRHAARRHVVFSPASVGAVHYDANEQSLVAVLFDADGDALLLQRTFERHAPHALDAIAAVLDGRDGALRHVAGVLGWHHGMPSIDPWALGCGRMVVPDFVDATGGALAAVPLGHAPGVADDPCAQGLERLRAHLATLLHHGARRVPARWAGEAKALAHTLDRAGLRALSQHLLELQQALPRDEAAGTSSAAADVLMRLAALVQLHRDAAQAQRVHQQAQISQAAREANAHDADDTNDSEDA